jgi:hypothetical protein
LLPKLRHTRIIVPQHRQLLDIKCLLQRSPLGTLAENPLKKHCEVPGRVAAEHMLDLMKTYQRRRSDGADLPAKVGAIKPRSLLRALPEYHLASSKPAAAGLRH